jgi:hypothetical protein
MNAKHLLTTLGIIYVNTTMAFAGNTDTIAHEQIYLPIAFQNVVIGLAPASVEFQTMAPDLALATAVDLKQSVREELTDVGQQQDEAIPADFYPVALMNANGPDSIVRGVPTLQ